MVQLSNRTCSRCSIYSLLSALAPFFHQSCMQLSLPFEFTSLRFHYGPLSISSFERPATAGTVTAAALLQLLRAQKGHPTGYYRI